MADDDRKARLAALAAKSGRNIPAASQEDDAPSSKPKISFRNYVPKDANLSTPAAGDEGQSSTNPPSTKRLKPNTDDPPKSALEQALAKTSAESRQAAGQTEANDGSWSAITPVISKKVNWDLKRDIADKMEKLERRTQKAIVEMLRGRLEREAAEGGEDGDSDLD
jgi:coiled-coil domain-containing protein 12